MFVRNAVALFAALIIPTPGYSQAEPFVHEASGIRLPSSLDDMNIDIGKAGLFGEVARNYTFSNGPDRIEVYVFKASYPNSSVWFPVAADHVRNLLAAGKPTEVENPQFLSVNSDKPNTIVASYRFEQHYSSASVAVIGFDKWIVIVQSVSKQLDSAAQSARMAKLLHSIGKAEKQANYLPLVLIDACPASAAASSAFAPLFQISREPQIELKTAGGLAAVLAAQDANAESETGLANRPDLFCQARSASGITKWFRPIEEQLFLKWISTVKITGLTIQGMAIPSTKDPKGMTGAVITNDFEKSSVASFSDALPDPVQSQIAGLAGLIGSPKYAFVRYGTNEVNLISDSEESATESAKQQKKQTNY